MATERTLSILKPDATKRNLTGKINTVFEDAGLRIVAQRRLQLSQAQAEAFYGAHKEPGFFKDPWVGGQGEGVNARGDANQAVIGGSVLDGYLQTWRYPRRSNPAAPRGPHIHEGTCRPSG